VIPFVGGVLCAVGIVMFPADTIAKWWWIPLIVDLGSTPLLLFLVVKYLKKVIGSQ
jgi:hypothetical protein